MASILIQEYSAAVGRPLDLAFVFLRLKGPIPKPQDTAEKAEDTVADKPTSEIRCPLCRWNPRKDSRWTCWDCGHPEYFYEGCGTDWNTFETGGRCPGCSYQWVWTSCLSCWAWSKHEDWYAK